jgi:heptosyltransferase I
LPYTVSVYQQVAEQHYGKPLGELPWGARVKGSDIMPQISISMVTDKLDAIIASLPTTETLHSQTK